MPSFSKLPSGHWRVQIRRRGRSASKTFRLKTDAERWGLQQELRLESGDTPASSSPAPLKNLASLIDLHLNDMAEVGKASQRSKDATLQRLKKHIGSLRLPQLTREHWVEFGRTRAKAGAGPATLAIDLSFINTVFQHAAAIYGFEVPIEQLRLARIALCRLGLVGKSEERDRRPTEDEINRLLAYFKLLPRTIIPMGRIVRFAIASCMRESEITRILVDDFDAKTPCVLIRQRKHPRDKASNDQVTFSNAFAHGRGILVVHTFNEGEEMPNGKTKQWVITPNDGKPISIAVICEEWRNGSDSLQTFIQVTTPANVLISRITDRMPAILSEDQWPMWLGEADASPAEIKSVLQTFEDDGSWTMTEQAPSKRSASRQDSQLL